MKSLLEFLIVIAQIKSGNLHLPTKHRKEANGKNNQEDLVVFGKKIKQQIITPS
jgi:hypothetical protein